MRESDVTTIGKGLGGGPRPTLRVFAEDSDKLGRPAASHQHVAPQVTYPLPPTDRPRTYKQTSL